jgi:hypothetical protein
MLSETIGVARLIEERNQLQKKVTRPYRTQPTTATIKTSASITVGVLGPPPNLRQNMNPTSNVRRISNQEARERREKTYVTIVMRSSFWVIVANDPNYS